ncbi:MAG: ABC transporter ATP-binding protein [Eubacterium sp.]|nr:ABC transporter ATP-binding protein [Eubacterium sp.]
MRDNILLTVDHVSKFFYTERSLRKSNQYVRAVDDVSLTIAQGETLGLVGESGSGKTTLARIILGLLEPTSGSISLDGTVGAVFQDPASSLNPRTTIYRSLERPLELHGIKKKDARDIILETAERVNLGKELLDRFPHELSGGQQQRVSIARAIMLKPKLLVLDEPTSALDVSVQAQTLNELLDLQERFGLAYLFISHNLAVVRYMSDRISVMYGGKIMEQGDAASVYSGYKHPYTLSLLSSVPPLHPRDRDRKKYILSGDMPSLSGDQKGCRFASRCKFADEKCFNEEPPVMSLGEDHTAACFHAGNLEF